jgi:uncharacterized iron-regulated membrane protein
LIESRKSPPPLRANTDALEPERRSVPAAKVVTSLRRVVWRWHFYAGIIVAPVLIVMAGTGAIYIFCDEIEELAHARVMFIVPGGSRVSYEQQLATAAAAVPGGFTVRSVVASPVPTRATIFYVEREGEFQRVFVDPYHGTVLGQLGADEAPEKFFDVVLEIHRSLFIGTVGRVVTELVTCWSVVLVMTGAYLWWPRKLGRVGGTWLPRIRRHPYFTLRDWHAVTGAYIGVIVVIIACTGLMYAYAWGAGYSYAENLSGANDLLSKPPPSRSPAAAKRLPLDAILAEARENLPGSTLLLQFPRDPGGSIVVFANSPSGPASDGVVAIDPATGEVLIRRTTSQYPALKWWRSWNYPLHVGSILGVPTKIVWLLVCFGLMLLPITGTWMWWQRRPTGRVGLPRRPDVRLPKILLAAIGLLCVALPMLGASVLLILEGEFAASRWARRGRIRHVR